MERKIYNPIQKDYVTFLKTNEETDGEYTLVEVGINKDLIYRYVKF